MTERDTVEILRLIEETRKFTAEQHKLIAEASKFRIDRWLAPFIVIFGALGSFTASWAAVSALWHIAR
jgi:hypothetical protein